MIPLYNYIIYNSLDCHIHLFDETGKINPISPMGVGFADYSILEVNGYQTGDLYKIYEKNRFQFDGYRILACSPDPVEAIKIYEDFECNGFGEIKCYNTFFGETVLRNINMKNKEHWKPLFKYAHEHTLPIWIHWSLITDGDYRGLMDIVTQYYNAKFILCHCGVGTKEEYAQYLKFEGNPENSFYWACDMAKTLPNVYLDVSWTATELLVSSYKLKSRLPLTKIVIGSDLNPNVCQNHSQESEHLIMNFEEISKQLGHYCYGNVLRIFS